MLGDGVTVDSLPLFCYSNPMARPSIHEGCGGKIQGVYIRVGNPAKWVALGRLCLTCRWWEVWNLTPETAGGVVRGARVTVTSLSEVSTVTPPVTVSPPADQRTATADGHGAPDFPPVDEDKARAFREKWAK